VESDTDCSDEEPPFRHYTEVDSDSVKTKLALWSIKHNITHAATSDLLKIIQSSYDPFLPGDARSLLKTEISSLKIPLKEIAPGQYYHFGVRNGIIQNYIDDTMDVIKLVVGIDGLPLTKSSKSTFWPILCYVRPYYNNVFPIGLYWGNEKPNNSNDFLDDFVKEIRILILNGIKILNKSGVLCEKKVVLDVFSCDVPAKSFVLKTKGHAGYFSCSRCMVEGDSMNHRICFPDLNCVKRTHENFISRQNEEHHTDSTLSILTEIPGIDIIKSFSLDYMHLVCLGVTRKLINLWLKGPLANRIGNRNSTTLSFLLLSFKKFMPKDFQRKPRGVEEVNRWKATEFRTFLLYFGPIVLKNIINKQCYNNFLCLHVSMTLLLTPNVMSERYLNFCQQILEYFIKTFGKIYGTEHISHNIHALQHICDDYKNFGPLDNCSCFPFENHMSTLKKYIRKSHQPLQQAVKRYTEYNKYRKPVEESSNTTYFTLKNIHNNNGPVTTTLSKTYSNYKQFKTLKIKNTEICTNEKDCFVQNTEKHILKVVNIIETIDGEVILIGFRFDKYEASLYDKPISSCDLGIFLIKNNLNSDLVHCPISNIRCKCTILKISDEQSVALPILHTFKESE